MDFIRACTCHRCNHSCRPIDEIGVCVKLAHPRREPGGPGVAALPLLTSGRLRSGCSLATAPESTYRAGLRLPWLSPSRSVRRRCWSGNGPLPDLDCGRRLARPRAVGAPCLYITGVLCKPPLVSGFYRLFPVNLAVFTKVPLPLPSIQRQQQKTF